MTNVSATFNDGGRLIVSLFLDTNVLKILVRQGKIQQLTESGGCQFIFVEIRHTD